MTWWSRIEVVVVALVALSGCIEPGVTVCAGGRVCPAGLECDDVHGLCVQRDQLFSCEPRDTTCTLPSGATGSCDQGVCIEDVCGDGLVTGEEDCEPNMGMTLACTTLGYYDAVTLECSNRCVYPEALCTGQCGDNMLNGPPGMEVCDGTAPPPGTCLDYGFERGSIACGAFCGPEFSACRDIGIVPAFPNPGEDLDSVYVAGPGHWFVGELNDLIEVDNGTIKRTPLTVGSLTQYHTYGMHGRSASDIDAVGNQSAIFHFDGTSWTMSRPPDVGPSILFGVWGSSPNDVYAVGDSHKILHKDSSGWSVLQAPDGSFKHYLAIYGTSATNIYIVGAAGVVRRYNGTWSDVDVSACWDANGPQDLQGVWGTGPSDMFIVGRLGTICHFNGSTWTRQPTGEYVEIYAIWGRASNDVFAVGFLGTIFHYDGVVWRRIQSDTSPIWKAISGSGSDVVLVGMMGAAGRYPGAAYAFDGGPSPAIEAVAAMAPGIEYSLDDTHLYRRGPTGLWNIVCDSADEFTALYVAPTGTVFAADAGFVTRFDGVSTCTPDPIDATAPYRVQSIAGRSETDVYAGGGGGEISHWNGIAWSATASPVTASIAGLSTTPTSAFAVGDNAGSGFIMKLSGTLWSLMTIPAVPGLRAVWAASDTSAFAVGDGGTILHFDGTAWTAMSTGLSTTLRGVKGTSATDVFAVGDGGLLLHYDGTSWTPVKTSGALYYKALDVRADLVVYAGAQSSQAGVSEIVRDSAW